MAPWTVALMEWRRQLELTQESIVMFILLEGYDFKGLIFLMLYPQMELSVLQAMVISSKGKAK